MKDSKDSVSEYAAKCLTCFLGCLERFIKFLNKHAYVEVAMRSSCFCVSAVNGAKVVLTNSLRFGVLHGLGEIIMNIAVFFIVVSGTYFGYIMIRIFGPEKKEFHGTAGSLIVDSRSPRSSSPSCSPSRLSSRTSGKSAAMPSCTATASTKNSRRSLEAPRSTCRTSCAPL